MTQHHNPCQESPGFSIFWCQMQEFYCFLHPSCRSLPDASPQAPGRVVAVSQPRNDCNLS